jgi:Pectate lyase superfamily protein
MPLPGDITTITVTGTYLTPAGAAMSGTVTFTPSTPVLVDTVGTVLLGGVGVTVALTNGAFSVVLPNTGQLTPSNWSWTVTESITGLSPRSYSVNIPHSLGSTVDISTLSPIVPAAITVSTPAWVSVKTYGASGDGVHDDTAAINNALAALPANGGTIYFPAGLYLITSTLTVSTTGTTFQGDGWGSQIRYDGTSVTTAIKASANIRVNMRYLRISQTNATTAGTCIDASNFNMSILEMLLIDGGGSGVAPKTGILMNSNTAHYNHIRACRISYGGASSNGISLTGGAHSNSIIDCRMLPQTDDAASSGIYINGSHSTNIMHADIEAGSGNGIWLDTAAHSTTITGGYVDTMNICLKISSGVIAPTVLGGTYESGSTANIQNNGAIAPNIQNAWPNSGTSTYNHVEMPNTDLFTVNGAPVPGNLWHPVDMGFVAWNYDPVGTTNSTLTVNGTVYLAQLQIRYATTISKLSVGVSTAATTVTANQNFLGLYNASGTRVAVTAAGAIDTGLTSSGILTASVVTPYAAAAGMYWVAFVNNASTAATLSRASGANLSIANGGLSAAAFRYAVNGTTQTSLPSSITPASNTVTGAFTMWAAAS